MWCPLVRVDGDNRHMNMKTSGFDNAHMFHHCIGSKCMGWRVFSLSHVKGSDRAAIHHGYCGFAGRPDILD